MSLRKCNYLLTNVSIHVNIYLHNYHVSCTGKTMHYSRKPSHGGTANAARVSELIEIWSTTVFHTLLQRRETWSLTLRVQHGLTVLGDRSLGKICGLRWKRKGLKFTTMFIERVTGLLLKNGRPTWCHLLFYFTSYVLNMFRTLIYPSSGACDCCRLKACNTSTTQNQPHQISNTQRTENKTTDVVIQQHSRKLLMMDIIMSETC